MGLLDLFSRWPVIRQFRDKDSTILAGTAMSERSRELEPRTVEADKVIQSICPCCAVGCGQKVYVKDGRILDIEGDEDPPISRPVLPQGRRHLPARHRQLKFPLPVLHDSSPSPSGRGAAEVRRPAE